MERDFILRECPGCGHMVPQGSYCLRCGSRTDLNQAYKKLTVATCPECNKRVASGKYCTACGYQMDLPVD